MVKKWFWQFQQILFYFIFGAICALAIVFISQKSITFGAIFPIILVATVFVILKPDIGVLFFILTLLVMDEFPSALGESAERSTRTPFYSTSLGISGFYSTDLFIFGLLSIYFFRMLLFRIHYHFPINRISVSILMIGLPIIVSVLVSIAFKDPFGNIAFALKDNLSALEFNPKAVKFIAMFQYKTFLSFFLAYLLGLFFIRSPDKIQLLLRLFFIGIVINIIVGFIRLALNLQIVFELKPLFYHSPSSWLFTLTIFFTLLSISYQTLSRQQTFIMLFVSSILVLFILLSFRRTMWAGGVLSGFIILFYLPKPIRKKWLSFAFLGFILFMILLLFTPLGHSILNRLGETTIDDHSTFYRVAIFYFMRDNFLNIPLFGYGPQPLWNVTIELKGFVTNMENVHSLYYWYFLRNGLAAFCLFFVSLGIIFHTLNRFIKQANDPRYKVIVYCIFIALVILLFSGIFNPIYGEVRYMILMGLSLAIFSRILQFQKQQRFMN